MSRDPDPARSLEIDLVEPCAAWRDRLPDAAALCIAAARRAFAAVTLRPAGAAELAIVLGDDLLVRSLNRQWRGRDGATNVLSFPALDGVLPPGAPLLLGDVVLAYETIAREAADQGKPLADHLQHLVVHGTLHLLGFDHEETEAAERMEALETCVLSGLGVADPYSPADSADPPRQEASNG